VKAGGDARIAPASSEALSRVLALDVSSKHIILLTDGYIEDVALARQAAAWGVTISTWGLAERTNRSYFSRLAQWAHGESYYRQQPLGT
jgi:hypothetical protein